MESNTWYKKQLVDYYQIKQNVHELIKLSGTISSEKITFTYISLVDSKDINKTHHFFIFCPFITGLEKHWEIEKTKMWDQKYELGEYSISIPYFFIKDDTMRVPVEFYDIISKRNRDILIYEYHNFGLKDPEYIIIGPQPTLYSIEYERPANQKLPESWYQDKILHDNVVLKFTNPLKNSLPFPTKNIQLELTGNRTFFKVSKIEI
jgi:hypothetical protein